MEIKYENKQQHRHGDRKEGMMTHHSDEGGWGVREDVKVGR